MKILALLNWTAVAATATLALAPSTAAQTSIGSDDPHELALGMAPYAGSSLLFSSQGEVAYWDHDRPDRDAPLGVPFTQTLDVGQWLVAYTYHYTSKEGLRDGSVDFTSANLFAPPFNYTVLPTEMTTQTHQLEALYGWDGDWTVFARLPVHVKDMDNLTSTMATFETSSSGIGDVMLGGARTVGEIDGELIQLHIGLSIPTGSIDERDRDQNGMSQLLPYTMQLGTGTFDLHPGVTYKMQLESWSWGLQGRGRIHIEKNSDDWAVSDGFTFSGWAQTPFNDTTSGSLRVELNSWGDYHGENLELEARQNENPLNDEAFQGGMRIDLLAGLNVDLGRDSQRSQRVVIEGGVPVDEWLDGPQLSVEWLLTVGYQLGF